LVEVSHQIRIKLPELETTGVVGVERCPHCSQLWIAKVRELIAARGIGRREGYCTQADCADAEK
jgi:hypothetical protein